MRVKRFLAGVLSASMLSMMCAGTLASSVIAADALCGDADGSGHVNPGDTIAVLNAVSGAADTAFAPEIADVNLDGVINECDAAAIAAYYMGKIDALPAEAPITIVPADPFPHEFSFSMDNASGYAGTTIPVNIYLDQSKDYDWLYELDAMRLSVSTEGDANIKVNSVYMNASFWIGNTDGTAVISGAYVKDEDITKPVATVYLEVGADVPEGIYAVDFVAEDCFIGNIFGQTADKVSFTGGNITVNTAPETLPTTVVTTTTTTTTETTTTTTACVTETASPEQTDFPDETTPVPETTATEETTATTVMTTTTSAPVEETTTETTIWTDGTAAATTDTHVGTVTTSASTWNTTLPTTNMTTTTWLTTFPTTDMTTTTIASTLDENGEVIYGTTMPADTAPSGSDSEEEPIATTTSETSDDGTGTDWEGSDEVNGTTAVASDADTTETTTAFTEIAPEEPVETEASTEIAPETSETTETIVSDEASTETTEPAETLPQTGNPAWFGWMIAFAAMLMTAGGWMMMQSGIFKKDEE